jgi:hypothetical protein
MKISKKDDILKLYEEGFNVEEIVEKGFSKKYVKQVLKNIPLVEPVPKENLALYPESELKSDNVIPCSTENINHDSISKLKEIVQLLENLDTTSISIDINISINKNVQKAENTETIIPDSSDADDLKDSINKCECTLKEESSINPIAELKSLDKEALEKKLTALKQKDLVELIKSYITDVSDSIYKKRSKKTLINYIIEKLHSL